MRVILAACAFSWHVTEPCAGMSQHVKSMRRHKALSCCVCFDVTASEKGVEAGRSVRAAGNVYMHCKPAMLIMQGFFTAMKAAIKSPRPAMSSALLQAGRAKPGGIHACQPCEGKQQCRCSHTLSWHLTALICAVQQSLQARESRCQKASSSTRCTARPSPRGMRSTWPHVPCMRGRSAWTDGAASWTTLTCMPAASERPFMSCSLVALPGSTTAS